MPTLISLALHQTRLNMHRFHFVKSQLYAFIHTSSLLQRPLLMDLRPPLRAVRGASSAADSSDTSSSLEPLSYPERDLKTYRQSVAQTLRLQMDITLLARTDTGCTNCVRCPTRYGTYRLCAHRPARKPTNPYAMAIRALPLINKAPKTLL